jgi:hypothetical protein
VAGGPPVDSVCGEVVAEEFPADAPALCCSPALFDCWLSAVELPAPDEPTGVAVAGVAWEPLSPAVDPEPVPVWLSPALSLD